jgi:hypothetical protein
MLRAPRLCVLLALMLPSTAAAAVRVAGPAGPALPASPAGLSVETDLLPDWFTVGSCQSPARAVLRMAGSPEIRIGGNSQDRLLPSGPLPAGQRQIVDARFIHAVRCVGATGSPVILGLNLLARDPEAASDILTEVGGLVPRDQLKISLGNEPDLYGPSRLPPQGDYPSYLANYSQTLGVLRARLGSFLPPVVGPDPAAYRWAQETARFVREVHPAVATAHLYGLNGCQDARLGIASLLDPAAQENLIAALAPIQQAARDVGVPAQLTEANSVACGGQAGVSNVPASAVWALGVLGSATGAGWSRVQFHASRGYYDAFVVQPDGTVRFRPLWTAILLADSLWPEGTRPLRMTGSPPTSVRAFAARRADGGLAVLVVNRSLRFRRVLHLRTAAHRMLSGRLLPAGRFTVTLDGRRLAWNSTGPRWTGRQKVLLQRVRHGRVRIALPPQSAVWLQLDGDRAKDNPAVLTAG